MFAYLNASSQISFANKFPLNSFFYKKSFVKSTIWLGNKLSKTPSVPKITISSFYISNYYEIASFGWSPSIPLVPT